MTTTIQGKVIGLTLEGQPAAKIQITGGHVTNGSDSASITGGEIVVALDSSGGFGDLAIGADISLSVSAYVAPPAPPAPPAAAEPEPAAKDESAAPAPDAWTPSPGEPTSVPPTPIEPYDPTAGATPAAG